MNTWTPLWSQVVDSSLWEEKPSVRVLFMTMLALKDADHIVRYDAFKLHKKAHLTASETKEALEVLSSPDKRRQEFPQEHDGRRIQEVEEGWLILNGEKYREMIQKMKVRDYKTQWQREKRASEKVVTLTGKDAEAFEDAKNSTYQRRRKIAKQAGQVAGGTQAVNDSMAEANGQVPHGTIPPNEPSNGVTFTRPT